MKEMIESLVLIILLSSCGGSGPKTSNSDASSGSDLSTYKGTASISQGVATTTVEDIFICERGRKTNVGEIASSDGKKWTVPASTNYQNETFPFAPDLYNSCNGNTYSNSSEAFANLSESSIVEIDQEGEVFTAYIFADNYFEMYVNGTPVAKDPVPFTQFNSSIVQFKVKRPFVIAMKLVDWEEHLGIGCEANRGKEFHAGDGGMVAVIRDKDDNDIAITNPDWKAQTFYTAPIKDLTCVEESGNLRYSQDCDSSGGQDGTSFYGLHWDIPDTWMNPDFDDSNWPNATTFSNETIGVDNKPAYTNFVDLFDDSTNDAQFIWSTNVVLDNEVLVRFEVQSDRQ